MHLFFGIFWRFSLGICDVQHQQVLSRCWFCQGMSRGFKQSHFKRVAGSCEYLVYSRIMISLGNRHKCKTASSLSVFPPLLQTVLLIWKHSDYYHDPKPFAHLLNMLSNEVGKVLRSSVKK